MFSPVCRGPVAWGRCGSSHGASCTLFSAAASSTPPPRPSLLQHEALSLPAGRLHPQHISDTQTQGWDFLWLLVSWQVNEVKTTVPGVWANTGPPLCCLWMPPSGAVSLGTYLCLRSETFLSPTNSALQRWERQPRLDIFVAVLWHKHKTKTNKIQLIMIPSPTCCLQSLHDALTFSPAGLSGANQLHTASFGAWWRCCPAWEEEKYKILLQRIVHITGRYYIETQYWKSRQVCLKLQTCTPNYCLPAAKVKGCLSRITGHIWVSSITEEKVDQRTVPMKGGIVERGETTPSWMKTNTLGF